MLQDSQSTTSSVDLWLDDHPDQPKDYVFEQPKSSKRKRTRPPDHTSAEPEQPSKRRRLMEISGNNAKSPQKSPERKLRSSRQSQTPATPTRQEHSKTTARHSTTTDPVKENLEYLEEEDLEQMPTPRPKPTSKPPSLRTRPTHPIFQAPPSRPESSDSGESRGSKKPRSQSPTKRLGDLQFSDMPVDSQTWSSGTIPQELKDLVRDMQGIGRGAGVIPLGSRDKFARTEEMILDFQWEKEDEGRRRKEEDKAAMKQITGGLGHDLFWYRASTICEATNECLRDRDPEPAWNSEVHSAILRLALTGHYAAQEVWYKDITVARISNKSLVPWNIATGAMQSKMVDYAILINPSQKFTGNPSKFLHNHIIEKLRTEKASASISINQTDSEWVRFKPIAVNVETKRGAVGEDEAHVQLATWLTAQYSRLRQLMPDKAKTKLPSFPVLSVQGQRWLLMIASLQDNDRINLIKELYLGDTDSVAGVYQVIAAIRRIAQWVNDDYRPWFEKEVLGFKGDVSTRP